MLTEKRPRRFWIAALSAAFATAGLSFAHPTWASELGLDFWNVPSLQQKIARDRQFRIELDRRDEAVMKRIGVKDAVIDDLMAGRIDLFEAAADFRALNLQRPEASGAVRALYPAATEDESLCLNVLSFVDACVQQDAAARPAALRLRADFERRRAAGTLRLPAVTLAGEL